MISLSKILVNYRKIVFVSSRFKYSIIIFEKFFRKLGFQTKIKRNLDEARIFKSQARSDGSSHGFATAPLEYELYLFGRLILNVTYKEGYELTAAHFGINRSVKDLTKFRRQIASRLRHLESPTIVDPGCGCGVHLMYLTNLINGRAIGLDVYRPAIHVARDLCGPRLTFLCADSLSDEITHIFKNHQTNSVLLINSWLSYVSHDRRFPNFKDLISENFDYLVVIWRQEERASELFADRFRHEELGRVNRAIVSLFYKN